MKMSELIKTLSDIHAKNFEDKEVCIKETDAEFVFRLNGIIKSKTSVDLIIARSVY